MSGFLKQKDPVRLPVPHGRVINEHFGRVSTREEKFSVFHITADPGWKEKKQRYDFDEIIIMIKGKMRVVIDQYDFKLLPNETLRLKKGTAIEMYNDSDEPLEYWSVCLPAFSFEKVHVDNG